MGLGKLCKGGYGFCRDLEIIVRILVDVRSEMNSYQGESESALVSRGGV